MPELNKQKKIVNLFNFISEKGINRPFQVATLEKYFETNEIKNKVVLDAGCGIGETILFFNANGCKRFIGADISFKSLLVGTNFARNNRVKNINFLQADIQYLPFLNNSLDIILCYGVLHYIENTYEILDEFLRVAKQKSILLLAIPRKSSLDIILTMIIKLTNILPFKYFTLASTLICVMLYPLKSLLVKYTSLNKNRNFKDLILESLFTPVFKTFLPEEIKNYFQQKGFKTQITNCLETKSMFILKAKRK